MNNDNLVVIYDISGSYSSDWLFATLAAISVLFLLLLPLLVRIGFLPGPRTVPKLFVGVILLFVFGLAISCTSLIHRANDRKVLRTGTASYVEGNIDQFRAAWVYASGVRGGFMPHRTVSFAVGGKYFYSSEDSLSFGELNLARLSPKSLGNGRYVRIWYVGDDILKLEARE